MKKIFSIIAVIVIVLFFGVLLITYRTDTEDAYAGDEPGSYRLSTEDIYMEVYDFSFRGSVGSGLYAVESEEDLEKLELQFMNVRDLPGFEELLEKYPLGKHVYLFSCWYGDSAEVTPLGLIIKPDENVIYTDCNYHRQSHGLLGSDSEPQVVYPKVILAITEKAQIEDVDLNAYKGYYEQK